MDLGKLKILIELVAELGISELEIVEADSKIRIVKNIPNQSAEGSQVASVVQKDLSSEKNSKKEEASDDEISLQDQTMKSPMVGTFYRAAQPEADPFVQIGSVVSVGQTLCIVEAMKLMNEIESDLSGTIKSILVENGSPVEYGQPLFVIESNVRKDTDR